MIGILFTTETAAAPFLETFERGRFAGLAEGETTHDDNTLVSILGSGKIKATLRTERLLVSNKPEYLVLATTATSLSDEYKLGDLVGVSQVFEGDRVELSVPTYPRMPLETPFELEKASLVTQDHTPASSDERTYWQRIAELSDMVGYAVSYVAATHGVGCRIVCCVAGISGVPDKSFQKTLATAHQNLADFMSANLSQQ